MTEETDRPAVSGSAAAEAADPWRRLRALTPARIGLGRSGAGLPTARHLEFQLAHARARDAVQARLDAEAVSAGVAALGWGVLRARARAADLATHLRRPDLGRRLDPADDALFQPGAAGYDLAVVVAGGLSAAAVNRHAVAVLTALRPALPPAWRVAPVALIEHGRVAIGDDVASRFGARLVLVLIGERPGLSAPDSLGAYVTWAPVPGTTDEARHCVSNIRPDGLRPDEAARQIARLLIAATREGCTGIALNARLQARAAAPLLEAEAAWRDAT